MRRVLLPLVGCIVLIVAACSDDGPTSVIGATTSTSAGGDGSGAGGASGGGGGDNLGGNLGMGGNDLERWILSIDNDDNNTVHKLVRISVDDATLGTKLEICADVTLPTSVPQENIISSLTFNQGKLYASGKGSDEGDTLMLVDPCHCTATEVGKYGYTYVAGITSNGDDFMFGMSTAQNALFTIDPTTALGTLLTNLQGDWSTVGLTWSGPSRDSLWCIQGAAAGTDALLEFDFVGTQLTTKTLDYEFGSVGVEYHPGLDTLYACSTPGHLLTVDTSTGHVTVGPDLGIPKCNNLAAPFGPVECVPNIE